MNVMVARRAQDPDVGRAQRSAEEYVGSRLGLVVTNASLRATEPSRYVFAVFYQDSLHVPIPGRYLLVGVDRDAFGATELETTPSSPYWIRGLK